MKPAVAGILSWFKETITNYKGGKLWGVQGEGVRKGKRKRY